MKRSTAILVCASFLAFTVFYYQYQAWNDEGCVTKPKTKKTFQSSAYAKTPKIVIILAQTRSGSSFLGEIFNQHNDVAYFYEPLYPFGTCPRTESRGIIDYFYSILRFDFNSTRKIYKNAFSIAKRIDNQCQATGICFSMCEKCAAFIHRDARLCLPTQTNGCQVEKFLNGVSGHAKTVKLLAFKVCYLCDLKWIEPILRNPAYDVKIVHLVRDPRAMRS